MLSIYNAHTWIWVESQGVVSSFDGFSRAYVVKIRPSDEFLEGCVVIIARAFST
jgi:hypothetical protein